MIIQPKAIENAVSELRARGLVPCFLMTSAQHYYDSRSAYTLAENDLLQIDGLLVLPDCCPMQSDERSEFLVLCVESELAFGGVS